MTETFELVRGAESLFASAIGDIERAQRRVWIESYLLHDDRATRGFIESLGRAASRGLEIRLRVDGFGAGADAQRMRPWIEAQGIELRVFRPRLRPWVLSAWRRLHRKLMLIDEDLLYIGGINLLSDWEDPNHGPLQAPRLDYAVRCQSARLLAQAIGPMAKSWWRAGWRRGTLRLQWTRMRRDLASAQARLASGRVTGLANARLVFRDDLRRSRAIEQELRRLLRQARTEICIAMAYFVPTGSLRRLLVEARQRGVRVSLLIQGRTEYWWARWAEQVMVEELLEAGVDVWEFQESFLHAKVLVADDWTTVGSSNWDPFSLWLAMEANLLLKDADFAQSLKADLQRHMTPERASQRVTRSALGGLLHRPQRLLQRLMLSGVLWVLRAIR